MYFKILNNFKTYWIAYLQNILLVIQNPMIAAPKL